MKSAILDIIGWAFTTGTLTEKIQDSLRQKTISTIHLEGRKSGPSIQLISQHLFHVQQTATMEERSVFREFLHELPIGEEEVFSYTDQMEKWAQYFNSLIQTDFPKLVSMLYRIDISENKLKLMLNEKSNEDAGKIIASLVYERLLQKISSRVETRSKPDAVSDDPDLEAW